MINFCLLFSSSFLCLCLVFTSCIMLIINVLHIAAVHILLSDLNVKEIEWKRWREASLRELFKGYLGLINQYNKFWFCYINSDILCTLTWEQQEIIERARERVLKQVLLLQRNWVSSPTFAHIRYQAAPSHLAF